MRYPARCWNIRLSASADRIEYQLKDMIQRYFGKANSK